MSTLEVAGLCAGYGDSDVVSQLSFSVASGELVALLGANGAGKSTTLKAIMGLTALRARTLSINGVSLSSLAPYQRARLGLGYVPEDRRVFAELTVAENLEAGRRGRGPWTQNRVLELFPALGELLARRGDAISGGEQQMLTLARTLMGNPEVVLLDEPTEGVAPLVVERLVEAIAVLKKEGVALVLAEQNLDLVEAVSDRVVLLQSGRPVFLGSLQEPGARRRCEELLWS